MRRRSGWAALAAGVVVAALAGCGGAHPGAGAWVDRVPPPLEPLHERMHEIGRHGGRFVVGATESPKTFNALMANEQSSTDVTNLLFTSLTDIDYSTLADVPLLARSWEFSGGGRTCTFHLRRGVAFSDGHPLTSADVMFSYRVAMDPGLHSSTQDALFMSVNGRRLPYAFSAPDSYTFVATAPATDALLLDHVSSVRILPEHVLAPAFRAGSFASAYGTRTPPESLVTSGAFRLKELVPGAKTTLVRNPYWFGVDSLGRRLPYLDEVDFLVAKDQNVAALKFHAGELDGLDNVRPEDYQTYAQQQQAEHFHLYDIGPSFNTNFLWFNLNRVRTAGDGRRAGDPAVEPWKFALFSRREFRRAVSMAIDREAIIRGPFFGYAVKNWSLLTSGNPRWYDSTLTGADFDTAQARRLLAGLGLRDRNHDGVLEDAQGHAVEFTLVTNGDNTVRMAMATLIKDDLARVGIRAIPAGLDFNTLVTHVRNDHHYDACLLGLGSAVPADPGMGQNVWKSSGLTHYWDIAEPSPDTPEEKRVDALMEENVSTTDDAARRRSYRELMQIVNDQCWLVWLPTQLMKIPVRDRFGNVEPSPMPHRILWNADRIFVRASAGS